MSWNVKKSKELGARQRASRKAHTYNVQLTGEEFAALEEITLLNRRMLGDRPEHEILDQALTMLMERLLDDWKSTEEARAIKKEWDEMMEKP